MNFKGTIIIALMLTALLAVSFYFLKDIYFKKSDTSIGYCYDTAKIYGTDPNQKGWSDFLIFDLDGNGISIVTIRYGILFDINNDGILEQTGWVGRGDGLLVLDDNANGIIDNQSEIFGGKIHGQYQPLQQFKELRHYDLNKDGIINADDPVWSGLRLWVDYNLDAASRLNEIVKLEEFEINSIPVDYETSEEVKKQWEEYKGSEAWDKHERVRIRGRYGSPSERLEYQFHRITERIIRFFKNE